MFVVGIFDSSSCIVRYSYAKTTPVFSTDRLNSFATGILYLTVMGIILFFTVMTGSWIISFIPFKEVWGGSGSGSGDPPPPQTQ